MRRVLVLLLWSALLGFVLSACGGAAASVQTGVVGPEKVKAAIEDGAVVLDVRTPDEFATGHLADAVNIDVSAEDFEAKVSELDKSETYVLYCHSGNRSTDAAERMAELGFDNLVNGGGLAALADAGLELG